MPLFVQRVIQAGIKCDLRRHCWHCVLQQTGTPQAHGEAFLALPAMGVPAFAGTKLHSGVITHQIGKHPSHLAQRALWGVLVLSVHFHSVRLCEV